MVKVQAIYQGQKHCLAKHEPSGSTIETDAPKDNHGLGEKFSTTDLLATSLGTCILTTMAIVADRDGVDLKGSTVEIEKHMTTEGQRKLAAIKVNLKLPKSIPEDYRKKLNHVADACPVKRSIHPDIETPTEILYVL
jgi:putative redox protein